MTVTLRTLIGYYLHISVQEIRLDKVGKIKIKNQEPMCVFVCPPATVSRAAVLLICSQRCHTHSHMLTYTDLHIQPAHITEQTTI